MKPHTTLCPRCKVREKVKYGYCAECIKVVWHEIRARRRGELPKECPACGAAVKRHGKYCSKCAALPYRQLRRMTAERLTLTDRRRKWTALQVEARNINWRECRARGIIRPPAPPPHEITIEDFVSREGLGIGISGL